MTKYYETVYATNLDMSLIFEYVAESPHTLYDGDAVKIVNFYMGEPDSDNTIVYVADYLGVPRRHIKRLTHPVDPVKSELHQLVEPPVGRQRISLILDTLYGASRTPTTDALYEFLSQHEDLSDMPTTIECCDLTIFYADTYIEICNRYSGEVMLTITFDTHDKNT